MRDIVVCILFTVLISSHYPRVVIEIFLYIVYSPDLQQCYVHSSKLLASLSGFQVTRKSWRKEVFDLFLAHDFFVTSIASLSQWKVIIDNLMTQDQVTFRDLLARLHSTSAPGVVNLFSSLEQVSVNKYYCLLLFFCCSSCCFCFYCLLFLLFVCLFVFPAVCCYYFPVVLFQGGIVWNNFIEKNGLCNSVRRSGPICEVSPRHSRCVFEDR